MGSTGRIEWFATSRRKRKEGRQFQKVSLSSQREVAHLSPAANEGNDEKSEGCFGRGLSLERKGNERQLASTIRSGKGEREREKDQTHVK